jgi:hypothetical protein
MPQHGLDLCLEPIMAQGRRKGSCRADGMHLCLIEPASERFPIGIASLRDGSTQLSVQLMVTDYLPDLPIRVCPIARPKVITWMRNHVRPHWIELDVTVTHKQVTLRIDQAGLVPVFP